jgi:hypothetical protein
MIKSWIGSYLVVVLVSFARAELRPQTSKELAERATNIVVGRVLAVYSRDVETNLFGKGTIETKFVVEIEVEGVEKGDGIKDKDVIYVRCWHLKKRGGRLRPGPVGHDIPATGDRIRAYLVRGGLSPAKKKDTGLAALEPNGLVTLSSSK